MAKLQIYLKSQHLFVESIQAWISLSHTLSLNTHTDTYNRLKRGLNFINLQLGFANSTKLKVEIWWELSRTNAEENQENVDSQMSTITPCKIKIHIWT